MITQVIKIYGTVQGVGFRPTTARLAREYEINGYVRNMGGFVQLIVSDEPEKIDSFVELIEKRKPPSANITSIIRTTIETMNFDGFTILRSVISDEAIAMIPADIAICDKCLAEFYSDGNYRYKHPFISCSDCGPRYTIMNRLPYDRDTTTMDVFPMCKTCEEEYHKPEGRRYHAQTISCHSCGPMPLWHSVDEDIASEEAIQKAIAAINNGNVIALKGVGGYYFTSSPFDVTAVNSIREIKVREQKPFAIMFKDVDEIRKHCKVDNQEEELLLSGKRPIVLLERIEESNDIDEKFAEEVFGNSRYIGAFLPSFGLQYLLLDACGPLIMTSANISSLPIIKDDEAMFLLMEKEPRIEGALYNKRKIVVSTDDSVCRIIAEKPQLIRRSKGYSPTPVLLLGEQGLLPKDSQIFAAGGHLKASFSLSKGTYAYPSKCFGDLDSIENENQYSEELERMKTFFNINPTLTVCDLHPRYVTTRIAREQSSDKLLQVQHHHAHIASVMAEHGLNGPVIGVCFDGTGYGEDGRIWGGEILLCEGSAYERYSHLKNVKMIGGDSSMKDAWKSAVSHIEAVTNNCETKDDSESFFTIDLSDIIEYSKNNSTLDRYDETIGEGVVKQAKLAIKNDINVIESSSMGRLFDAASALLGIKHVNEYEGECAIMLENAAYRAINNPGENEVDDLALIFHKRIAAAVLKECLKIKKERGVSRVALSGGVFQNKVLMEDLLMDLWQSGFVVYFNQVVPANDGGIALGQNYIGMLNIMGK